MEEDKRSRLLATATELFARKGFSAVSVRELAIGAKCNVAAVSYYFNGKEGLYQAVLEEQLAPILAALQSVKNRVDLSPVDRLAFYADQIANIHGTRPCLACFIMSEMINPTECGGETIQRHISQAYQFMFEAIATGIKEGFFRSDLNVNFTAVSLAGILNFFFLMKPLIQKNVPLSPQSNEEYTAHAFQVFLQGILPPDDKACINISEQERK
ncbi:MAG: TetR family transcriptional regulator [Sporomusaceae bacterium]|nr:TetR family transcriptional regulator [Sporomusaceae bacterium]